MSRYDYPRLPRREIIAVLRESEILAVSDGDLLHPNPDFVVNLYTRVLNHLDCLPEDYGQVDFAALEQLENPDHHVDSVRITNLFHRIKEVVAAVECPREFTLRDLVKPEPDRTELFLSALLNFCLHRNTKMDVLKPDVEDLSLIDDQRKELESRISQLNAEMAEINESRGMEMHLVQELDSNVKQLEHEVFRLNKDQASLRASIRKMNNTTKDMDEKISNAAFALLQSSQENAELHSRIVQSPDKLQSTLEEKKSLLAEAKNAERAGMQSFSEKTTILEAYTQARNKLSKHSAQMEALQEQVNSAKLVEKDVKVLKAKHSDDGMLVMSLDAKIVQLQGQATHSEEFRKQLEKERDISCAEASKERDNVKYQVESNRRELESRQRNVKAMAAEVSAINAKVESERESGKAIQQELFHTCEEIVKEFDHYSISIGHLLSGIEAEPEIA